MGGGGRRSVEGGGGEGEGWLFHKYIFLMGQVAHMDWVLASGIFYIHLYDLLFV